MKQRFVLRERDRRAVFDGFPVHFLAIHYENTCAALAEPGDYLLRCFMNIRMT